MSPPVLAIEKLSASFGGLAALDGVNLHVAAGEIVALIGPNGAGKTTLLNCISGLQRPRSGSIHFRGQDLTGRPPHRVAAAGVGRTFQHLELFGHLSVADNVLVGRHLHFHRPGLFGSRRQERAQRTAIAPILRLLGLEGVRDRRASELPYGQQKLVGLARALALQPGLLLLDEPAAGMHQQDKDDFGRIMRQLRDELGIPMLWIEHDLDLVAGLASLVAVLDFGTLIALGLPHAVLRDPRVARVYLGE
ncbi:MAG TPA: ABC transporter ATP-binding protein [Chloroflexota bacterium]|jgi:branched-chain amino acid transport system ATP-binding protein